MSITRCFAAALVTAVFVAAQPVGSQLAEVRLISGKRFSNVTVVRLEKQRVILRNSAGPFPLAYTQIAEPLRSQLVAARDGVVPAAAALFEQQPARLVSVSGSAFAGGTDLPYRFADMRIVLVPANQANEIDRDTYRLGRFESIAAETKTDIDGKFTMSVPPGDYVLYARQLRSYRNGNRVVFSWRLPVAVTETQAITLSADNASIDQTLVRR